MIGNIQYKDNWWVWLLIDEEFTRYLRRLFLLGNGIKLQRPSQDSHITVISSHEKENLILDKWKINDGIELSFNIDFTLYTNSNAYWYPVISKDLDDFRSNLGLTNPRKFPLHLGIGYLTNEKIEI